MLGAKNARKNRQNYIGRLAVYTLSASLLAACSSQPKLWQGDDIIVEARQEVLERDVYTVSDNHRELKDRFDALERLYVELVQSMRLQEQKMATLQDHVSKVQKDPEVASYMKRVSGDIATVRQQMKKLENRVFSVEATDNISSMINEAAPTGTAITGATVSPNAEAGTPVNNNTPATQQTFFGIHLASYRSQDQVASGWAGLEQAFGNDLEGLTPLIYTQSQEGIGTFMRLIAGPLITEQEAISLCGRIRQNAAEQYCRVSEYQGEPIG
ncbi:kinetochore Spc7 family protein [Kordiimonas pumila]|uniref:SPOR domain-containing protein n=1 Tax=Kordiimonas pumila TaxID=2161677 RepID=A0ABV7D2G3_9PROT|nr:hypothetical protein [Kordiimonas pumila]